MMGRDCVHVASCYRRNFTAGVILAGYSADIYIMVYFHFKDNVALHMDT